MIKYFLLPLLAILFSACGGGGGSSTPITSTLEEECNQGTNAPAAVVASVPHTESSIPMLVVLVNYNNQSIISSDTTWSNKIFGTNEHELNHYFKEVSNNNFKFTKAIESSGIANDGIVSINLNKNHPDSNNNTAIYPDLKEALTLTDSAVDFSSYDTITVDNYIMPDELVIVFIIAGYEDSYAGMHVTNGVWAHNYCMTAANSPTLDGVALMDCNSYGDFVLLGEQHGTHDATIGIIAHELGHSAFLLPDLYNTSPNNASGGIGYFGLMGIGNWGTKDNIEYAGNTPTHFSAWSKVFMEWYVPSENRGFITLHETFSPNYNIEKYSVNPNCYFLFENRNNKGYDKGLFSLNGDFEGGMAIWKIDKTKLTVGHFILNEVNADTSNKGVDLVEATASNIDANASGGDADDLYYNSNITTFSTMVTNISARGSQMTLNVN